MTKYLAHSRRKCAGAQVNIILGDAGPFLINKKTISEYFQNDSNSIKTIEFLINNLNDLEDIFTIQARVYGGGLSAQKDAICGALARGICQIDKKFIPILKKKGFLTQDSRIKERRKYGLKKARKAPQYSKR
jgi:small subunit ribosomal protein S9|uniref:Small ribosomal subunit protein uS9c n=1 Tax=Caulerpa verticillata TaxID=177082 RepID=A0A386B0A0_9CHLO|nr:ribosomal protein S9 [Caulerpa verticillata]AYC65128.1 ribosomal protein S9 [Caulerpa verticillata]